MDLHYCNKYRHASTVGKLEWISVITIGDKYMSKWHCYYCSFQSNKDIKCLFYICSTFPCKCDYWTIFSSQYEWKEWAFSFLHLQIFLACSDLFYCQSNKIYNEKNKIKFCFSLYTYVWNSSRFTDVWMWLKAELCLEVFVVFQGCSKNNCSSRLKILSPKTRGALNSKAYVLFRDDIKYHFSCVNSAVNMLGGKSGYMAKSKKQVIK